MFWKTQSRYEPGKLVGAFLFFYGCSVSGSSSSVNPTSSSSVHPCDRAPHGPMAVFPMILGGLYLMLTAKKRRVRVEPRGLRQRLVTPLERALLDRIRRRPDQRGQSLHGSVQRLLLRDPRSARPKGDFTTAPEISQMFGEIVGAVLVDCWKRAGSPADAIYAELGPGRGTLASDALRLLRAAGFSRRSPFCRDESSPAGCSGADDSRRPDGTNSSRTCPKGRCCWSPTNSSTHCRCGRLSIASSARSSSRPAASRSTAMGRSSKPLRARPGGCANRPQDRRSMAASR